MKRVLCSRRFPPYRGVYPRARLVKKPITNIKEAIKGWLEVMEAKRDVDPSVRCGMVEVHG